MAIPEAQLEVWSHQGAIASASATYASVQAALRADSSPLLGKHYEVYLQGSYKNSTNIRGDSDVDVVVQLNATFGRDLSALPPEQVRAHEASFTNATYPWPQFRIDTLRALRAYYGTAAVSEGNRSLKLRAGGGRLAADIIPALHFRRYEFFYSTAAQKYTDGIKFFSRTNARGIINFPKPHFENGVLKQSQSRTGGRYKGSVRMFKNARTYLVDRGALAADVAPFYFVECLLYNVPDSAFGGTFQDAFTAAINWLWSAKPEIFLCQNEQLRLFGQTPEQWEPEEAGQFLRALKNLWDGWH